MPRRNSQHGQSLAEWMGGMRADYNAAKQTRFRRRRSGATTLGAHADWHYRTESDYLRMMELARDFDRNDVVVGQGITRLIDHVLVSGITPDPDTGDPQVDRLLKDRWHDWANQPRACHAAGRLTFSQIERLVLRHIIVDGDHFVLPITAGERRGRLETVEGHRCRTPSNTRKNVVHGVELDDFGAPLRYWFTKQDLSPTAALSRVSDTVQFAAVDQDGEPQVLHVLNPRRVSQTRGVTALAPIADIAGMHDDLQFAQLVKAQIASVFAILRTQELDGQPMPGGAAPLGERSTETLADGSDRTIEGIAPGMQVFARPGEKIEGFSPNVPNQEFFSHAQLLLTFIAVNLNMPLAALLIDGSQTNFSGWRGAMDIARTTFREIQRLLVDQINRPVWRWRLMLLAEDDLDLSAASARLGDAYYRCNFNLPAWPYIEPLKDASADLLQMRNALSSPRRIQAARGRDWDDLYREIVEDNAAAIKFAKAAARALNDELADDDPVHWRELLSLPTPDGVTVTVTDDQPEPPPARPAGPGRSFRNRINGNGHAHAN